jgi:hypothetical protein
VKPVSQEENVCATCVRLLMRYLILSLITLCTVRPGRCATLIGCVARQPGSRLAETRWLVAAWPKSLAFPRTHRRRPTLPRTHTRGLAKMWGPLCQAWRPHTPFSAPKTRRSPHRGLEPLHLHPHNLTNPVRRHSCFVRPTGHRIAASRRVPSRSRRRRIRAYTLQAWQECTAAAPSLAPTHRHPRTSKLAGHPTQDSNPCTCTCTCIRTASPTPPGRQSPVQYRA